MPCLPLKSHHLTIYVGSSITFDVTAALCELFLLLPTSSVPLSSFWQVQVPYQYTKTHVQVQVQRFSRSPMGRAKTFAFQSLL